MDGTVSGLPGVEYICRRTGGGKACRNQHRQPAEYPECGTDAAVQSGNDRSGAFYHRNLSLIHLSYNGMLTSTISSVMKDTKLQKAFYRYLVANDIPVTIESNGVYYE